MEALKMNIKKRVVKIMSVFYKVLFECDQELIPEEDDRILIERCSSQNSGIEITKLKKGARVNEYLSLTHNKIQWQKTIKTTKTK